MVASDGTIISTRVLAVEVLVGDGLGPMEVSIHRGISEWFCLPSPEKRSVPNGFIVIKLPRDGLGLKEISNVGVGVGLALNK